jgi:hypothetical protein
MTMASVLCYPATTLTVHEIADLAVTALRAEADLTPKPGLVDCGAPMRHPPGWRRCWP